MYDRRPAKGMGMVHHSDCGSQYLSIRYSERLAEAGIEPSVGSVGDSYDNALAETINGLFKAEVIHRRGPWRSFEAVEYVTLEWVDWFNNPRLPEPIGNIPPAEAEANFYAALETEPMAAHLTKIRLRQTRRGSWRTERESRSMAKEGGCRLCRQDGRSYHFRGKVFERRLWRMRRGMVQQ